MDVAAPEDQHYVPHRAQEVVDALLPRHDADVADQVAAAAFQPLVGGLDPEPLEARSAAHDKYPPAGHAPAPDGDAAVGLIGGYRDIGDAEGPVLELEEQPVDEIAAAELGLVELGAKVMVVEHELLAQRPERDADQKEQVRRIARVDDVEAAGEKDLPAEIEGLPQ